MGPPIAPSAFRIRRATPADRDVLIDIWWRSASSTHRFLSVPELEALLPEVRALQLERLETWVLCGQAMMPVGFLVMNGQSIDALFIAPECLRQGGGRQLLRLARALAGPLTVEVNEQNTDAIAFYRAQGFEIVRRSPIDSAGRPYPLLHMADSRRSIISSGYPWVAGKNGSQ